MAAKMNMKVGFSGWLLLAFIVQGIKVCGSRSLVAATIRNRQNIHAASVKVAPPPKRNRPVKILSHTCPFLCDHDLIL